MVTGRLGYAWNRILLYVKGGAAFVPIQGSVVDTCLTTAGGCGNWVVSTTSDRSVVTTWTIGGGVEWAFATNWSVKAEYMFIGLDDTRTSCGVATVASGAAVPGGPVCFDRHFDGINTAKVGLNYKFSWKMSASQNVSLSASTTFRARNRSRLIAIASRSGALASHSTCRMAFENSITLLTPRRGAHLGKLVLLRR